MAHHPSVSGIYKFVLRLPRVLEVDYATLNEPLTVYTHLVSSYFRISPSRDTVLKCPRVILAVKFLQSTHRLICLTRLTCLSG